MKRLVFSFLFVAILSLSLFQRPVRNENHVTGEDIWIEFVIAFSNNISANR